MSSSQLFRSIECLILGRFFIGLNCGINTALVPMYLSEIAPVNLRGALGKLIFLNLLLFLLLAVGANLILLNIIWLFLLVSGTVSQLGVTIGLLLSQILGLPVILGTKEGWPFLLGVAFIPAVLQLLLLPLCPESPRYLLISRDRVTEARYGINSTN